MNRPQKLCAHLAASRRQTVALALITTFSIATYAAPVRASSLNTAQNPRTLPIPASLQRAAQQAAARGEPLVLMASLPGCPWCELLRRNYLGPLRSEMPRPLVAVEISITDGRTPLADFEGRSTHARELSARLRITTTPTVLFFNARGQEVAPRIEGVASADFIGAVLDERITAARAAMNRH